MAAAASSTCAELRKLVESCSTGAGPEGAEAPNGRTRATTGKSAVDRPQVACARAAPAVDGLARVTDRGHRMAAAEQCLQQHQLGVAGASGIIQQDHLVAGALGRPDLRVPAGDPGRERHLVRVVEHLARRLGRRIPVDQRQKLLPGPLGSDYLPNGRGDTPWQRIVLRGEPPAHGGYVTRIAQVLGQVAGQLEQGRGHRLRGPGDLVHRPVVGGHDPRRELPGQRGGDQPHGRLEPFAQGVVADQPPRVGVIGADHRVPAERVRRPGGLARPGGPGTGPVLGSPVLGSPVLGSRV